MLLLFIRNTWDEPHGYPVIPHPAGRPQAEAGAGAGAEDAVVERPKPAPVEPDIVPESKTESKPEAEAPALSDEKLNEYIAQKEEEDLGIKNPVPDTKEEEADKDKAVSSDENTQGKEDGPSDDASAGDGSKPETPEVQPPTEETVDVHSQNPPNDGTSTVILDQPDVHWKPIPEHYPLPEDEITPLPTGTPKQIPKIQYDFGAESDDARSTRQQRLKQVKEEIARAWGGYKKFAWGHDELSPVSAKYRDPFCGWAATLVDSLDTLWIAGLKEEFDEAAHAVKDIDFTITERNEIPVFETTIRYLGGLLAAFDVSGGDKGEYHILLQKAEELATILIGIFDTPNRMPILYYNWKPEHASQPHRASSVGIAELGTLSMEFTRLAQLTGENKYYDAVNRITDALVEMQEAGRSQIPGLFPENLDASGCNKTALTQRSSLSEAAQEQLEAPDAYEEPVGYVPGSSSLSLEEEAPVSAEKKDVGDSNTAQRRRRRDVDGLEQELENPSKEGGSEQVLSDDTNLPVLKDETPEANPIPDSFWNGQPGEAEEPPFAADGKHSNWDCVPQGLVPSGYGSMSYHMGGGQDSAYEYFPKQWLLLGGLEPKYQKLYEDSVAAINEWLLYRPMIEGDWDALFTAKVAVSADPDGFFSPEYEVTHLTCFIGGMYGLGGRIFGREQDIEIAKKLTDGCVWAYDSMPSGLMPEHSHVVACPTLDKCEFNQTVWWEKLDLAKDWREREMARWDELEAEEKEMEKMASLDQPAADNHADHEHVGSESAPEARVVEDLDKQATPSTTTTATENETGDKGQPAPEVEDAATPHDSSLRKRAAIPVDDNNKAAPGTDDKAGSELPDSLKQKLGLNVEEKPEAADPPPAVDAPSSPPSSPDTQRLDSQGPQEAVDEPIVDRIQPAVPTGFGSNRFTAKPERPVSHEEFVKKKIDDMGLAPGFVDIMGRSYILR